MYGNKPSAVERYVKASLDKLGLDYLDMYLVHMPYAFVEDEKGFVPATNDDGSFKLEMDTDPVAVWKVFFF